jgi:hypothetical protein
MNAVVTKKKDEKRKAAVLKKDLLTDANKKTNLWKMSK